MPTELSRLQFAEYVLQVIGLFVICAFALRLRWSGSWRETIRLPAPSPHDLQPLDILIAAYAFFLLPRMLAMAVSGDWAAATTQSTTTRPVEAYLTHMPTIIALIVGQCASIGLFCLLGYLRFRRSITAWGLNVRTVGRDLLGAIVAYVAVWPICSIMLHVTVLLLLSFIPNYVLEEHGTIEVLRRGEGGPIVAAMVILSATFLAPMMEELFFRGLLQPAVARATGSQTSAIVIVGAAFGLIHYTVPHTVPALMVFGMILGYIYARCNSLTLVILIHAIFNSKTILWLMLDPKG